MNKSAYAKAKASGDKFYFSETPCINGHTSARYVNGGCIECRTLRPSKIPELYGTWYQMRNRCTNEEHDSYDSYGGRGITVCERWLYPENGYDNFVADMGPRPQGYTLDRIDNDGNYEPSNCRWADAVTQQRNTRHAKLKAEDVVVAFTLLDNGMSQRAVSKIYKCSPSSIRRMVLNREKYIEAGLDCRTKAAA